ncbi:transposase orfB for insertion sequence element IS3 family protein [Paenibacillus terrae HPL-003]|uniref:Transposase orfB for insertion sequence element IS3 family protein n=1 Tax=Paenibacillus terrae (strain HPL-003) TaxID=985665 RepID=G7W3K8_PAETH|nr:DDE-type integrase/transposase/recombinase [Paenibacillus terrae]AET58095.1 transposase orfB for insertion sequence element IS3 family protein [Paenibacillus terrae HPL-003]
MAKKWPIDITQYRVGEKWLYLSAVKDLLNNEIIAYQMSTRNDNEWVLQTFKQAWTKLKDVTGLIVHSNQGFQYTSHAYHDMLPKVVAQINMSRRGNCYDNASMESFSSHCRWFTSLRYEPTACFPIIFAAKQGFYESMPNTEDRWKSLMVERELIGYEYGYEETYAERIGRIRGILEADHEGPEKDGGELD